ncbi:hypothetical protein NMYAN_160077 [Nitrosomonas nitrosa]|uniref:Uncharacterized protein n=1 Tax=Nitrosomonas nitrosa TaxID=52442 RepID=A0A8H9D8X9_9PROT|nr:hypothetical protein NMYAN_160077 [Nitrosomonas nitrosa]
MLIIKTMKENRAKFDVRKTFHPGLQIIANK